jgi:hypothetical protein
MFGSLVQRLYWLVALAAGLGLVFVVSSAQAQNKNPGDLFGLGVLNSIDQRNFGRELAAAGAAGGNRHGHGIGRNIGPGR